MLQYLDHNPAQTLFLFIAEVPCGDSRGLLSVPGAVSNTLMSVSTEKAMVRREKLREVVGVNRCRINNSLDKEYEPRPAHIIVEEALRQEGKMMEYNFIMKNCEHFVNKLRYGRDVSWQVSGPIFLTNKKLYNRLSLIVLV